MQERKSIAIFGGSFNPPINSHIQLAEQILSSKLNIQKLIFVPVSTKYNKVGLESDLHRLNMLKIICQNDAKMEASRIEIDSERQLYTIETLNALKTKYTKYNIYFVLGTDNLKELKNWKTPEQILEKYKILILNRNKDNVEKIIEMDELLSKYKNSLVLLKNKKIDLSSTFIRKQIKEKKDVSKFLPKEILEYIRKNNLYKE